MQIGIVFLSIAIVLPRDNTNLSLIQKVRAKNKSKPAMLTAIEKIMLPVPGSMYKSINNESPFLWCIISFIFERRYKEDIELFV